jgi:phosphoribosyl 1,2-cyclic phosphate phosphodiesterase
VIDALKPGKPHPAHFSLDQALEAIARLRPKQAYLTHMGHEMEYDALAAKLPPGVAPAYDGLRFDF